MDQITIGFIGTGVMGISMAGHLLKAGYSLNVYNRTEEKAQPLLDQGAQWRNDPSEVAKESQVIITIVGFPQDVESVYLGHEGLIENSVVGTYLIDMSTSSPKLALRIFDEASERGIHALDAPVSGGDIGAQAARLSIMVGGERSVFEQMRPILEVMGKQVVYQGRAGSGQHTKMANQIAIAAGMLGVCEAIAYAEKAGLDPSTVLESIGSGAASSWSLSNLAPRMIEGDFAPGFYVKHFIKDMGIALSMAHEMGVETPALETAKRLYDRLAADGGEELGTQALYRLYANL